ncbi:Cytochrome b6-f complex iron-sulfur subunit [Candidatus Zixiibacteriota bacterium]|nr:Cytochrome b6-f complex iron-sulfur subunit [candidate division Zixibacteria bacterium]
MDSSNQDRRGFLNWLIGGGAVAFLGSVLYPVVKYIVPPASGEANVSQVKLPFKLKELQEDDKRFRIFKFGRTLGIIVWGSDNKLHALSAICTHLDCTVQYRKDLGLIWCACHNGKYDLEGRNISGPPPRPLKQFDVHVNQTTGDIVVAEGQA